MRKNIRKTVYIVLSLSIAFLFLQLCLPAKHYQGATSYTNAKEFYESTATNGQSFHTEVVNGTIYYATCAKLAATNSNLHYTTIGFDIELSASGHQISFAVERTEGSMKQVGESVKSNGYEYILYTISSETLYDLATKVNSFEASYILASPIINVNMDAILITKQEATVSGGISEDGKGGIIQWGTIYRLKNLTDLSSLRNIFNGHTFKSYYDIQSDLSNHQLHVRYQVQGLNSTSSTTATVSDQYTIQDGLLFQNDSTYIQKQTLLQKTILLNPSTVSLKKEGYFLPYGKEWVTEDRRVFSAETEYMPADIDPLVGQQSHGITMYANWQPNTYIISYDANGGSGIIPSHNFTFDKSDALRVNTFTKTGYYLETGAEWNTKADGTGTSYASEQLVTNLSAENDEEIILYANWKPIVVTITTDKNNGTGGTDTFYEAYGLGFFSDKAITTGVSSISTPARPGYTFAGYYKSIFPSDPKITDKTGTITIPNTYFLKNAVIYADYTPNTYTIYFDKQGGTGGTDFVNPIYDKVLPFAEPPLKNGASFKGYFTKQNGQGFMYYNEFMASDHIYKTDGDTTLYAYWVDETPPDVLLISDFDTWTNRIITLTASAIDYDSGLDSMQLYMNNTLIKEYKNLNGQMKNTFTFQNTSEGIQTYRLVAIDKNGNKGETNRTIYYDKKAPVGTILQHSRNGNMVSITVQVTDINVP